jgi:hypothetical protein
MQQQAPMASIIQAQQNKAQMAQNAQMQEQQAKQQKFQQVMQIMQMASGLVQQGMDYSAQRKQRQNNQSLVELIRGGSDMMPGGEAGTSKLKSGQTVPTMESIPRSQDPAYRAELLAAYTKAQPQAGAQMSMQQMLTQPKDTSLDDQLKQARIDSLGREKTQSGVSEAKSLLTSANQEVARLSKKIDDSFTRSDYQNDDGSLTEKGKQARQRLEGALRKRIQAEKFLATSAGIPYTEENLEEAVNAYLDSPLVPEKQKEGIIKRFINIFKPKKSVNPDSFIDME